MEEMKINSKTRYNRDRVVSGRGPHKMMKMAYQKMLAKLAREEALEKNVESSEQ
jgi:hypothetical protein